jgi:hypothetical protein
MVALQTKKKFNRQNLNQPSWHHHAVSPSRTRHNSTWVADSNTKKKLVLIQQFLAAPACE